MNILVFDWQWYSWKYYIFSQNTLDKTAAVDIGPGAGSGGPTVDNIGGLATSDMVWLLVGDKGLLASANGEGPATVNKGPAANNDGPVAE